MALYYSAGRTQAFSASRSTSVSRSTTDPSASEDWECSFYIFPNPSSLPPTPYSQSSDFSTPSEDALSPADNVIAPNSTFTRRRPRETSLSGEPQDIGRAWDWPKDGAFASNPSQCLPLHRSKVEKKPLDPAGTPFHPDEAYTAERDIDSLVQPLKDRTSSPPPHIHIPLLSFLAPLLSIDDSTLDLLATPCYQGSASEDLGEQELLQDGIVNIMHGAEKLLSFESDETFVFRSAMGSSRADSPSSPVVHLSDVLEIITGISGHLFRIVTLRV